MSPLLLLLTVLSQTPAPPPDPAPDDGPEHPCTEDAEEDPGPWSGSAGVGASFFTGNSRSYTLTGNALVEYESPTWAFTLEADGAYGKAATEDGARELVAEALGAWVRGEYRATPLLSAYSYLGAETDHLSSLELRAEVELGLGVTLLERTEKETDELLLRVYLGAHYARDHRFQYVPTRKELQNVDLWSPSLGAMFRYDINERVELREYVLLLPDVFGDTRVLLTSTTKLSVNLTGRFALTTFFDLRHDSRPAEGKVSTDTSLTVGGELSI
ncbi:Putative salt-induced outer membrane protein YdiY [Myxococcus fulvus]|uniref:Salt-induced outer membrane protein n=1 Tax=Myxococcus fulvus TaxID=33 RepID=A0A511TFT2_MYXFU|nr:DUF481 domain-containing protein [Myxococcus fulvus]AKF80546.1 hypothetical protein MFUL124B02_13245 [Myxococcus fulvus 124B02]GEN12038.1 salt-induced outer membrane protein [Myxococcus fulvus]SEU36748.1 Putative salt-induced outer membrane protein YdiY [Myxococcus fulvus]